MWRIPDIALDNTMTGLILAWRNRQKQTTRHKLYQLEKKADTPVSNPTLLLFVGHTINPPDHIPLPSPSSYILSYPEHPLQGRGRLGQQSPRIRVVGA